MDNYLRIFKGNLSKITWLTLMHIYFNLVCKLTQTLNGNSGLRSMFVHFLTK